MLKTRGTSSPTSLLQILPAKSVPLQSRCPRGFVQIDARGEILDFENTVDDMVDEVKLPS